MFIETFFYVNKVHKKGKEKGKNEEMGKKKIRERMREKKRGESLLIKSLLNFAVGLVTLDIT